MSCQRRRVDVLPFGGAAPRHTFVHDGVEYDVSGMAEGFETADLFDLGGGHVVRSPSLGGLILIKLVAWDMRRNTKDAADLGQLLDATSAPPFIDDIWDQDSGAEIYDYDPEYAGPYVQTRQIAPVLRGTTRLRLLSILTGPHLARLSAQTPAISPGIRAEQYAAIASALTR